MGRARDRDWAGSTGRAGRSSAGTRLANVFIGRLLIASNCHGNNNSYPYFDTETFTDAETSVNAQAASYSTTTPLNCLLKTNSLLNPHRPASVLAKAFGVASAKVGFFVRVSY